MAQTTPTHRAANAAQVRSDGVLTQVRQRYYAVPGWLPVRACYFCDRYFGGQGCIR